MVRWRSVDARRSAKLWGMLSLRLTMKERDFGHATGWPVVCCSVLSAASLGFGRGARKSLIGCGKMALASAPFGGFCPRTYSATAFWALCASHARSSIGLRRGIFARTPEIRNSVLSSPPAPAPPRCHGWQCIRGGTEEVWHGFWGGDFGRGFGDGRW